MGDYYGRGWDNGGRDDKMEGGFHGLGFQRNGARSCRESVASTSTSSLASHNAIMVAHAGMASLLLL